MGGMKRALMALMALMAVAAISITACDRDGASGGSDATGSESAASESTGPLGETVLHNANYAPATQALVATADVVAQGAESPPNILVMWGDDVGWFNISANNQGMMGYTTPNLDRIAREGMNFTDAYGENSCTAGRAAFITGQNPVRTGLLRIGMPGADMGLSDEDPTIAELLKPLGYRTGQFGKNHLGDSDQFLPTAHGFDEFFGNLYHLNAEEEPENADYPTDPAFAERFGPRGVIHSYADGRIEDTGPLTSERMKTVDNEVIEHAERFIREAHAAEEPFFVWFNTTRMHIWTHLQDSAEGVTGQGIYADGMVEHDQSIGHMLDLLDELEIAENTIVVYSTDNGAEVMSWPDGGTIPWAGEKNTTWEGGFRVPMFVRWPGHVPAGTISNGIISHQDCLPTLLAAAGVPDINERLLNGHRAGDKTFRVHIDGVNQLDMLLGNAPSARNTVFYFTDDGDLSALRYRDWKMMFTIQEAHGMQVWQQPYTELRAPLLENLRRDPFERAHHEAMGYERWYIDRMFTMVPAQAIVANFLASFRQFPPRSEPASFNVADILTQMRQGQTQ